MLSALGREGLLAAASPLLHVIDEPFGAGVLYHAGDGSAAAELFERLAAIGLGKHGFLFLIAGLLTLLFFWSGSRRCAAGGVPGRWQSFVEVVTVFIRNEMIRPFMGEKGDQFLPLIAGFFVYIVIANVLGLIPFLDFLGHGGNTATASLTVTGGLAICSFFLYHALGVREQGSLWIYIRNLFPRVPIALMPMMILIELLAHIIRPCALAIRLFANMLAGHTLMASILGFTLLAKEHLIGGGAIAVVSTGAAVALSFLELLVALLQAFVFAFLTAVFLSLAVHPEH